MKNNLPLWLEAKRRKANKNYLQVLFLYFIIIIGASDLYGQTNIATSGTGAIWQNIPAATSTSNASKANSAGINNANLTTDIVLADVTAVDNWQAAGVTWATAQNGISSIKFYNGTTTNIVQENGVFAANAKLQSSTDGTTWTDVSGWSFSPAYAYSVASSNVIYTISGSALNNIRGIRVVGQLRTAANQYQTSWALKVKEVQVYNTASVAVTGVTVSPASASINVGATTSLTATIAPSNATNQAVTWSSSNTAIATVNSTGVVTAVAAGSATITVTTQDGAKTATSAITVTAASSNIATSGTGAIWQNIPAATSTSDASKVASAGINNANLTTDVVLADVSAINNWQAAGVTWATAQNGITSLKFYNGLTTNIAQDNGIFAAGIKVQSSSDGTIWTDVTGWAIAPAYPYSLAASNQIYVFSGAALNNVKGLRVVGQLRLSTNEYGTSWALKVKEVEVVAGPVTIVSVTGVSVSPTSSSVNVGSTLALTATVAPTNATNTTVTWSSSNTAIATINTSGVVTGVAAGNATITVSTVDGNKTATSAISVIAVPVVNVTSVSLSPTSATVNVGASTNLTATVLPSNATNKTVTWSSNNTAVANVNSSGVVNGVAVGSATITVTTQDGAKTATSAITVTTAPATTRVNMLGMNLGNPGTDYSEDLAFADAFRSMRYWIKAGGGGEPSFDVNYWPTEDAEALVWAGQKSNTSGTYKLSFTGQANITSGNASIVNKVYNSGTNLTTADVVIATNTSALSINFTGTSGGVKNVKLMRPITVGSSTSYPTSTIFTDFFINNIAPYKVLRSLGWVATNWSPDSLWSDRTTWQMARQSPPGIPGYTYGWEGRGASWEGFIMLANQTNKDVWITIPAKATDDYITKLAQLFKYGSNLSGIPYTSTQANPVNPPLNSDLKIYVEYSNEIWNWQFSQTDYAVEKALLEPANSPIRFDNETDDFTLGLRYKAMRSVQTSDIFRSVYGNVDMMTKVRPVMAWQLAYGDLTNRTLSFIDRYYSKKDSRSNYATPHPVNYYFYGGGASFYWYSDESQTLNNNTLWNSGGWNATAEFNDPYGNPYGGFIGKATTDAAWAKHYGLAYVCYEGDGHPTYQNNDEAIMAATHWDPRMKQNTLDHLNVLNRVDCEFGNFLSVGGSGANNYWAVINYQNEGGLGSPQLDAINQWVAASPLAINIGSMAPFTRPGNSYNVPSRNDANTGSNDLSANASADYTSSYLFRVPSNGTYNVKIDYSTTAAAKLEVEFNGTNIGTYTLANTNGVSTLTLPANFVANTDKLYSIRLVCTNGTVTVNNVIVESGSETLSKKLNVKKDIGASFSVYPNPSSDYVTIDLMNVADVDKTNIILTDLTGKVMYTKEVSQRSRLIIPTNSFSKGIYILSVKTGSENFVQKLIIQ
jgi:uncharacterized protein YjdB